ncbi:MAG: hypothetical protein AMJ84_09665, partial [Acidithiobacillales bacterium SM23_46]
MWEAIRANRRKSVFVIVLMASLLVVLGYVIGLAVGGPKAPEAALIGVGVAVLIWVILCLTAFAGGDAIMLATAGARRVEKKDMPRLYNVVEEMTISAGLPRPPEVYIIDSDAPNAFAVGKPERAAVAVTTGLLSRLSRDELQGVIAHEIGHINNFDCRFMVLAGVMVGAIVLLSDMFLRGLYYGGFGGRGRRSRDGNQLQAILMIAAIVMAILAPIFAHLLYLACSRKREYLADATSARLTRYPEGLASALEKIAGRVSGQKKVNRVIAPMYIVNPLAARGASASALWSTHPPTEQRVKVLRSMAGGASYAQYEAAYSKVSKGASVLGASALTDEAEVALREPSAEAEPPAAARRREAKDAIHRLDGYRFAQ